MLSEKQCEAIEETAEELNRRRRNKPSAEDGGKTGSAKPRERKLSEDQVWARSNLRFKDGRPCLDLANVIRVLERHNDFAGRFRYNDTLNKVLDKGSVMLDWRVSEVVAVIQERFLPEIPVEAVEKALIVHANRVIQKK